MGLARFTDAFRSLINKYAGHSNVATYADLNFLVDQLSLANGPTTIYYKVSLVDRNDGTPPVWGLKAVGANNIFGLLAGNTGLFVPTSTSSKSNNPGCPACKFRSFQTNSDWSNEGPWFVQSQGGGLSSACVPCWSIWSDLKNGQVAGTPLRVLLPPPVEVDPQSPFTNFVARVSNVPTDGADGLVVNVNRIVNATNLELEFSFVNANTGAQWNWTYEDLNKLIFEVTYLPNAFEGV